MSPSAEPSTARRDTVREAKSAPASGTFRRLNPLDTPGWDRRVSSFGEASVFHSAAWAGVLRDTYGHTPQYFCIENGGKLSAALPMMEVNSPWTGRRGVSLPFTDECALLSDGSVAPDDLVRAAMDFGRQRKWKYLECRGIKDSTAMTGARTSLSFFGHALRLVGGEDAIFSGLESSVRRGIRKAEKSGVKVEVCQTSESVRVFYSLHCKTRKKHGLPPQPFSFFDNIFRRVVEPGMGCTVVASFQGRPIAASMFLHFRPRAIYKFGASDLSFQHLRPNNLVMWEAIRWYAGQGFDSLDFGRTSMANEGLRRFKLGFGTTERAITYVKYDFGSGSFVTDRDRVFGWFNGVFQLMPMPLSRILGGLLYRHQS